jgi:hypothetical protein
MLLRASGPLYKEASRASAADERVGASWPTWQKKIYAQRGVGSGYEKVKKHIEKEAPN